MEGFSGSVIVGALLFAWTTWAVLFWGGVAIIERHNPFNSFRVALGLSGVQLALSMATSGLAGIGLLVVWMVFLFRLLLGRYELGVLHAIGVVLTTVAGPYFVTNAFVSFVGASDTLFMLVLYGVPVAVIAVWMWPRPEQAPPTNLPPARVARLWRKRSATATVAAAAPATAAAPAAKPAAAAPPAPPATAVAPPTPPAAPAPRADGEPALLH
jgi:hypothetical protein